MKRNQVILIVLVTFLLIAGLVIFRLLNSEQIRTVTDDGFRAWFWQKRGLDLIAQIVLVFAGALGIAAILPVEDDHDGP